jgi:hypothetical protein
MPKIGGTSAWKTPGLTKWKVPLRRNMKTIILVPIGKSLISTTLDM